MQATLDNQITPKNHEVNSLVNVLMAVFGILGLMVAALIILGWLPLGERADILRSHKNWLEYTVIVLSVGYSIACFRTFRGLQSHESASLQWARWVTFITIFIGLTLLLSVIIPGFARVFLLNFEQGDTPPLELDIFGGGFLLSFIGVLGIIYQLSVRAGLIGQSIGRTLSIPIRGSLLLILIGLLVAIPANLLWVWNYPIQASNLRTPDPIRLIPGLFLFLTALLAYRHVAQGESESDELRRAVSLTPAKFIQVQLAKAPAAGAIIGFIAIFMAFTMATDLFLRPTSIASVMTNVSSKGVIAIGVTILMISGEFDLSVGSILGVVAMLFMQFMTGGAPIVGVLDPLPAAILAVFIGAILGFINGFILVTTGIPSFIVTLGTMLAYRSISLVAIAGGRILRYRDFYSEFPQIFLSPWVFVILALIGLAILAYAAWRTLPSLWRQVQHNLEIQHQNGDFGTLTALASGAFALIITAVLFVIGIWLIAIVVTYAGSGETVQAGFFDVVNGRWDGTFLLGENNPFSVPVPLDANFRMAIVWWLIFVVVFNIILTSTSYGNSVFAVGGNVGAARAQGINVSYIKVFNFVLVAVLTGIAAIHETARNPGVDPLKGNQWELEVIAMTVIGGALLTGGYGSIVGSLLGALIFGMLQTGLVLVGIESRLFTGTIGVVIIVAVVLNTAVRGRQRN